MHPGFPTFLRGLYVKYQYLRNLKCLRYPSNIPGSCIDIISLEYDHPCFTMYFQRTATRFLSNEVFLAFLFKPMFPQVCPRFSHGMDIEKKMYRCFPSLKTWENIMWNFSLRLFAESQVRHIPSVSKPDKLSVLLVDSVINFQLYSISSSYVSLPNCWI